MMMGPFPMSFEGIGKFLILPWCTCPQNITSSNYDNLALDA